jgi:pimeloyl-ACP methyl ester carboxylesterase
MNTLDEDRFSFDKFTSRPLYGYYREPVRDIPILGDVDVLVVGGSQSGCAAAMCAARHGASVQLVERFGFLGGQSVYSSVVQWEKRAFINNLGAVATRGIAKEMVDRIVARGGSDGLWKTPPGCIEMRDGEEWLNVEAIQLTLIEMGQEANVELLFHTVATDVIVERAGSELPKMTGVIFENKTGRFAITAKVIIDATADLDLVWRATGDDGCAMREPKERMKAAFYVWYGGIDNQKYIEYVLNTPGQGGYPDPEKYPDKVRKHIREEKLVKIWGLGEILEKANDLGLLKPIEEALSEVDSGPYRGLSMKYVGNARWCCSFGGFRGLNLLDTWELTKYEILRIKLTNMTVPVMKLIPGWENCYITRTNIYMGGRESRYLKAVRMLKEEDIFSPKADIFSPENETKPTSPDTVGRSGAHDPGKNRLKVAYPVPYGMLVPERLDGVLCCTRAVGAEPPVALNAHRGIVPTIVVGQAAGTAAALAVRDGVEPRDVDLNRLQSTLRKDDVVLDVERVRVLAEATASKA